MKRRAREISIKSCMDREEREVGVNSVGDGQDRGGWKIEEESQRIGNVVLNTRSCTGSVKASDEHRNSYYNKRKKMDKLDEKLGEANWTETAGANCENHHGWTSGKKLRAVKWNVGELAMNCPASDR